MNASLARHAIPMEYTVPHYTAEQVTEAGKVLAKALADPGWDSGDFLSAYNVADDWRTAHQYPLNAISVVLKLRAKKVNSRAIVFQRVKRMTSILYKLRQRKWIGLAEMQDLGGCRAILPSPNDVIRLRDIYRQRPLHTFVRETDYLTAKPKKDGYRGIHLIYAYQGTKPANPYANMQIEIQLRTQLQHYWATAVETAETFTREAIKSRPKTGALTGWEEFFALVSTLFAHEERMPLVPGLPTSMDQVVTRLRELEAQSHFTNHLETFKVTAEEISGRNKARFFLLDLDPEARRLRVRGFKASEFAKASAALAAREQQTLLGEEEGRTNQVLVKLDDLAQLKRAYPNYSLDTAQFVIKVRNAIA